MIERGAWTVFAADSRGAGAGPSPVDQSAVEVDSGGRVLDTSQVR